MGCHGPTTQRNFLLELGIEARLLSLLKNLSDKATDDSTAEELAEAYRRLIGTEQMGNIYKALCITRQRPSSGEAKIPAGFTHAATHFIQSGLVLGD